MDLVRANWDGVQNSITLTQSTKKDGDGALFKKNSMFSFYCYLFFKKHDVCFFCLSMF
jgi:hypothetical protein